MIIKEEKSKINYNLINPIEYFDSIILNKNIQEEGQKKVHLEGYNFNAYVVGMGKFDYFKKKKALKHALKSTLTDESKEHVDILFLNTCDNETFLVNAHETLFKQEIDHAKLAHYSKMLKKGISRKAMVYILASTAAVNKNFCINNFSEYEKEYNKYKLKKKAINGIDKIKTKLKLNKV